MGSPLPALKARWLGEFVSRRHSNAIGENKACTLNDRVDRNGGKPRPKSYPA
jgi:acetyl-CoA carboxylase alpha subunit